MEIMDACGMVPDRWQREYLTSHADEKVLFLCRQAGKTDMTALDGVLTCATTPRAYVPIVAGKEQQASTLLRRAKRWIDDLTNAGLALPSMPTPQPRTSDVMIRFDNGARLKAIPASQASARSGTASKIIIDEAAWVPDEIFTAIMPQRTMTQAPLALLSSPWFKQGRFYEMYTAPGNAETTCIRWRVVAPPEYGRRYGVDLTGLETSGIANSPDVEIQVLDRMTYRGFLLAIKGFTHEEIRREMFGIFSDEATNSVFSHAAIDRAFSSDLEPMLLNDGGEHLADIDAALAEMDGEL
jgi:hypothetical protein